MVKKLIKWGMKVIKQKNVKPINASWYTPEPVMDHDQVFQNCENNYIHKIPNL